MYIDIYDSIITYYTCTVTGIAYNAAEMNVYLHQFQVLKSVTRSFQVVYNMTYSLSCNYQRSDASET